MPRNVRNFWIDARIDGRAGMLSGGPVAKDGGVELSFKMRQDGCVTEPLTISARPVNYDAPATLRMVATFAPGATVETTPDGSIVVSYRAAR